MHAVRKDRLLHCNKENWIEQEHAYGAPPSLYIEKIGILQSDVSIDILCVEQLRSLYTRDYL
ncbi:hypothetical protein KIN20_029130 [Parelaphostrongylus tenuis]|uniref:Uncharacterized protein n=1 Tax=Parelaphostrongylus tenuis TaxID=148309 RepID=A0AAD5R1V3_PARTN|nr:hypothetical protein KIN20_029130 [Parelaphostrongylus tenuis]